ncbi:MAG: M23 family metallopeptidase [Betaproteobacteria bacterium]|nr:M23 family metallopeptidase [Betaproteobacteria bacterium]
MHAHAESLQGGQLSREPLIEVVTFGVAPVSGVADDARVRPKPGDALYRAEAPAPGPQNEIETRTQFGESWIGLFQRIGGRLDSDVLASPGVIARIGLLPALEPGKYVRLRSAAPGGTVEIEYVVRPEEAYTITLNADGIQVRPHASDPRVVERMRGDPSKASLFTATDAIGLPEEIVLRLAEIFADDVDFHRELHHGYRSTIVYEVFYREGHIDRPGRILAAEFVIRNRRLQAFHFSDGGTKNGYYTETGKAMRKAFRKSPVEFSRVTSEYTLARFHPVLGLWRAHRGIDYAAPLGSKVMATADGVVEFMGNRGELGNLVILRHYGRFLTYYGHLNAFAGNLAAGSKVEKGQVIGYVGMTGLATGPHVHYEFRVDNGSVQGLGIPVPPPDVLEEPPVRSESFFRTVQAYRDKFDVAQKAHFVVLD